MRTALRFLIPGERFLAAAEGKGQEDTQGLSREPSREERQAGGQEQRPARGVTTSHKAGRPQLEEPTPGHASPLPSLKPASKSGHEGRDTESKSKGTESKSKGTESKSNGHASAGLERQGASVSGQGGSGSRDPRGRGADGASSAHDTGKQSKRHADGSPRPTSAHHPEASPRRHQLSAIGQGGAGLGRSEATRTPGSMRPPVHLSDDSDADAQLASPASGDEKAATRKRVVRIGQTKGALANGDDAHAPQMHCGRTGSGVRERGVSSIQRHLREEVATCIAVAAGAVRQQELVVSKMALQVEVPQHARVALHRRGA